jgi:hypothetical protein
MTTTGKYMVYGLTNWVDLECPDNSICINSCWVDNYLPSIYLKQYSMPYNNPKLKFVILLEEEDTEDTCEWLVETICEELQEYDLYDIDNQLYDTNWNWKKNFDTKILEKIRVIEEEDIKILVGEELELFEENEKKKLIEHNKSLDKELRERRERRKNEN